MFGDARHERKTQIDQRGHGNAFLPITCAVRVRCDGLIGQYKLNSLTNSIRDTGTSWSVLALRRRLRSSAIVRSNPTTLMFMFTASTHLALHFVFFHVVSCSLSACGRLRTCPNHSNRFLTVCSILYSSLHLLIICRPTCFFYLIFPFHSTHPFQHPHFIYVQSRLLRLCCRP